jgi:Tfp pilus assembly protein PilN
MNAVNLIPSDSRGRRFSLSASPITLGLFAALVVVLAAAVMYVSAANTVTARRAQLARVTAGANEWAAAANSYTSLAATASQRAAQLADVRQLVSGRYAWSQLLTQLGSLMPANAALSSLTATTTPGATPSAPPEPSVQLGGCAASQSTVANVMDQLRRVTGVAAVTLSTSSSTGATSSGSSGGCPFSTTFQISLTFTAASSTGKAAASASSTTSGTTGAAASATPTTTTGAAQ